MQKIKIGARYILRLLNPKAIGTPNKIAANSLQFLQYFFLKNLSRSKQPNPKPIQAASFCFKVGGNIVIHLASSEKIIRS